MDEQQHIQALGSLCRVCGGPANQNRPCKDHTEALISVFNVYTTTDSPQIHPKNFCKRCYAVLQRFNKAEEGGRLFIHSVRPVEWCSHSNECTVCQRITKKFKGGRPPKGRKGRGRPTTSATSSASDLRNTLAEALKCAPPSFFPKGRKAFFVTIPTPMGLNTSDVECSICMELLDRPVQTQCGSVLCLTCINR